VRAGRSTLLSVNAATDIMDNTVTDYYVAAPLDDLTVDEALDKWTCAILTVDTTVLVSWAILRRIENGPPKMEHGDVVDFIAALSDVAPPLMYMLYLGEAYGLDTTPIDPALDAIKKYLGTGEPIEVPDDLNCSEVLSHE
jgi:hypothetical protein